MASLACCWQRASVAPPSLGSSRRCGQTDYREVGAAARPDFIAAPGKLADSPRNRPHLPFRRTRRWQHLRNRHLWLRPTPEGVAPAAALSPESAQLLQTMARDLATVRQENEQLKANIEQLKTNQEQMTRDNASAAEQFKASQEQMARDIAKASEQNLRPKISAPPPRPTATPTRKPAPNFAPSQSSAARHTAAAGRTAVAIRRRGCPCACTAALNLPPPADRAPNQNGPALDRTEKPSVDR